ncbi:FAD-dependent oxidoreductase [Pelagivirga sediminicola]|uniref:FAD-dependent oxidoreductase n=1 Tax=Pelagivirga sediminicola TaxID=2170575 RepID=A0A2T7GBG9_9RHOB|nr:FAD-binding oxidoreductase [Pelagivirga sediminicola]PVA11759.1 FAD-dependent oxidoreductase [Pelagivirga sediminicola]
MDVKKNGGISFWYDDMGGIPAYRAPLPGDLDVDVCIIGAGYTGLWTAYYLKEAQPDLNIAIVEREFAGFGASGRNGGWLSGGFAWSRENYLDNGTRQGVMDMERALLGVVDEVIRVADAEGIDADIRRTDCLTYACSPAQMKRLRAEYDQSIAWGVPQDRLALIGADEAASRIRVKNAHGALVSHGVARVQPAKLVRGLAAAVERRGVRIYEQTAVSAISKGCVETDRGRVRADRIVRATEGYTSSIKGAEREWVPLNSAIVVTEPLPQSMWDDLGWEDYQLLGDASHAYCYAQRTREGRIAMGGRGVPYRYGSGTDTRGQTQPETIAQLKGILARLLPQTRGIGLHQAWCGVLGVPRDWCATAGIDPATGIAKAGGYVGVGVSTSNLSGQTLADLVLDRRTERTDLPWVNRKVRRWEPEPFRWLGIHAMYRLYHMADRREARQGGAETSMLARLANKITGR